MGAESGQPVAADGKNLSLILSSPFGPLGLRSQGGMVTRLSFLDDPTPVYASPASLAPFQGVCRVLAAYWEGECGPLHHEAAALLDTTLGTPWQRQVWARTRAIPPGETLTYGRLAEEAGGSARAIGQAMARNPIVILTPCHRVMGKNGLGGYAGGLERKRALLEHERKNAGTSPD